MSEGNKFLEALKPVVNKDQMGFMGLLVILMTPMTAYVSSFATAEDLQTQIEVHEQDIDEMKKDIRDIKDTIDKNEESRKKGDLQASIEDYTDKIHEIQIMPNKKEHHRNLINYYQDKREDLRRKI